MPLLPVVLSQYADQHRLARVGCGQLTTGSPCGAGGRGPSAIRSAMPTLQVGANKFTMADGRKGRFRSGEGHKRWALQRRGRSPPAWTRAPPKLSPLALGGFVSMCLATAMTLPTVIWLAGGGLCGGATSCSGPADIPALALVLLWLSVSLGIAALTILISARMKIHGSGSKLLTVGFVLAVVGTLIVLSIAFKILSRALNESI
jgi:hypothetical protein